MTQQIEMFVKKELDMLNVQADKLDRDDVDAKAESYELVKGKSKEYAGEPNDPLDTFNLQAVKLEREDNNAEAKSYEFDKEKSQEYVGEPNGPLEPDVLPSFKSEPKETDDFPSSCDEFVKEELDIEMNVDVDEMYESLKREEADNLNPSNIVSNEEKRNLEEDFFENSPVPNEQRDRCQRQTSELSIQRSFSQSDYVQVASTLYNSKKILLKKGLSNIEVNRVTFVDNLATQTSVLRKFSLKCGAKHFSCSVCAKSFKYKGLLKKHMRIHTGERPFSCNVCNKSFNDKSNLNRHMRTHTGERLFSCNDCNNSFIQKVHLREHMRTHTGERPFSCNECNKSFNYKSGLNRHMRTHTGERPFSCNDCNNSFTQKVNLLGHMRTHTGERPATSLSDCC